MVAGMMKTKKIRLFAISNAVNPEMVSRGVARFEQMTGMEVLPWDSTPAGPRHFAGGDQTRAANFNALLQETELEGLIAIRGGYGATRILEKLDFEALRKNGCFVCGYSDVTALLLAAWQHGCTRLIHGPMMQSSWGAELPETAIRLETDSFLQVLNHHENLLPSWAGGEVLQPGEAFGPLIVMNLTLLDAMLGTPFLPSLAGAVLALEDVSEPAHDIDRKLNHLRQTGILSEISGLLFGKFTSAEDSEFLPEIRREYAALVRGPVLEDIAFGHCHPGLSLPFGDAVQLNVASDGFQLTW